MLLNIEVAVEEFIDKLYQATVATSENTYNYMARTEVGDILADWDGVEKALNTLITQIMKISQ